MEGGRAINKGCDSLTLFNSNEETIRIYVNWQFGPGKLPMTSGELAYLRWFAVPAETLGCTLYLRGCFL